MKRSTGEEPGCRPIAGGRRPGREAGPQVAPRNRRRSLRPRAGGRQLARRQIVVLEAAAVAVPGRGEIRRRAGRRRIGHCMSAGNNTGRAASRRGAGGTVSVGDRGTAQLPGRFSGRSVNTGKRGAGTSRPPACRGRRNPDPSVSAFRRKPTWRLTGSRCSPGKTQGRRTALHRPSGARTGCRRACWSRARNRWSGWSETAARSRGLRLLGGDSGAEDRIWRRRRSRSVSGTWRGSPTTGGFRSSTGSGSEYRCRYGAFSTSGAWLVFRSLGTGGVGGQGSGDRQAGDGAGRTRGRQEAARQRRYCLARGNFVAVFPSPADGAVGRRYPFGQAVEPVDRERDAQESSATSPWPQPDVRLDTDIAVA